MYSNLVKADYEIKDMNLKELREILVKQNNLTPLDILKGFHEKSKIRLEYPSCITEENIKDVKLIQEEYKSYLLNNGRELTQKVYDEKFDSLLDEYQKEDADITIENIYHNINDERFNTMSVHTWNKISSFLRELSRISANLKSSVEKSAIEYITSWIKEKFGDKYKIADDHFSLFEELPYEVNVNKEINIDFTKVYETAETEYNQLGSSDLAIIDYNTRIKYKELDSKVNFYDYDMIYVCIHIEESKARSF